MQVTTNRYGDVGQVTKKHVDTKVAKYLFFLCKKWNIHLYERQQKLET